MAEEKKSIFDLADKFGVDSPFGNDWVKEDFKGASKDTAEIVDMTILEDKLKNLGTSNYQDQDIVKVPVVITVQIKGQADKVEIKCSDGQKRTAFTISKNLYGGSFTLSIPKSYVRLDRYNSRKFIFTAEVIDLNQKKITDKRKEEITIDTNSKIIEHKNVTNREIKIVVDPGHGYTKGNTGAVSFIYTYKIQGEDGKPETNPDGSFKEKSNDVMNLPQYVIDDPTTWIISKKEDPNHNERGLVFDIAIKLKELLDKEGYTCLLTRTQKVIQGNDDAASRQKRIDVANTNKAQYFVSIHADGASNNTSSGAHVIYPKTTDQKVKTDCIQFGKDIFKFYNVVQVESSSPKEDVRGLQVLSSSNKTNRKVLVELGFVTTPRDAKALFSNIEKIANQLYQGIIYNIKNNPL